MFLTKHHGLGNDFLVAMSRPGVDLRPDAEMARQLCERHFGIGADGLLWGLPAIAPEADLRMLLHNSDGSEAAISGNGIRCLAQAHLRSIGANGGRVRIETPAGLRVVDCDATDDPDLINAAVDMGVVLPGPVIDEALRVELSATYGDRFATRSVGNPHLVVQVDSLGSVAIRDVGPLLEASFVDGINVHFFEVNGPDHLSVLHWERGAGLTLACGSGATVTASVAHEWGLVGADCLLDLPGGPARVIVGATVNAPVRLSRPARFVAEVHTP